jgi:hypothetical protein
MLITIIIVLFLILTATLVKIKQLDKRILLLEKEKQDLGELCKREKYKTAKLKSILTEQFKTNTQHKRVLLH